MAGNEKKEDEVAIKLPPKPKQEGKTEESKPEEAEEVVELEEVEPSQSTQHAGSTWTPESVEFILKMASELLGKNLADKFLSYQKNDADAKRFYFESVSKHNRKMIYVLTIFLGVIVAFMSLLTVFGLVSGDALLFLVGTITGYLLLFIQRLVFPSKEEPPTEEIPT
jgi:hypothetical protein